jgi:uncharacterized protein (DUF305 family)
MVSVNGHLARSFLLTLALFCAGCNAGSDEPETKGETAPNIVQPGAPGQGTRTLTPEELENVERTQHKAADVRFMQGMIHHHAQALRMTNLVRARSKRRDIALLAKRIDLSQTSEIELMHNWLEARKEAAPELHRVHGHAHGVGQSRLMPGMLTERQLKRLARARGIAFDRLFLRSMIHHHQGAVAMVEELYAGNGGAESEIDSFARHVDSDQQIEIDRMRKLLAKLRADGAKPSSAG